MPPIVGLQVGLKSNPGRDKSATTHDRTHVIFQNLQELTTRKNNALPREIVFHEHVITDSDVAAVPAEAPRLALRTPQPLDKEPQVSDLLTDVGLKEVLERPEAGGDVDGHPATAARFEPHTPSHQDRHRSDRSDTP
jgi:hypothetical protein